MKHTLHTIIIVLILSFKSNAQVIPNADFECINQPDSSVCNWGTDVIFAFIIDSTGGADSIVLYNNMMVGITHDSNNGNNALEINNLLNFTQNICMGMRAAVSSSSVFSTYLGGIPISSNPSTFGFFYKYISAGGDSALARIDLLDSLGENVGSASIIMSVSSSTYTFVSAPLVYSSANLATTAKIIFSPSIHQKNFGSSLIVDDLSFNNAEAVKKVFQNNTTKIYPNPTNDKITVQGDNLLRIELLNAMGEIIFSQKNYKALDLSNQNNGLYYLKAHYTNDTEIIKVIKE